MKKPRARKTKTLADQHAEIFVPVSYVPTVNLYDLRQPDFRPMTTGVVSGGAGELPVESWSAMNAKLGEVLNEINQTRANLAAQANAVSGQLMAQANAAQDTVRRKYLTLLHQKTGRNVIAYYSGFLSKPENLALDISDEDKNGFMTAVHQLDRSLGLDLLLHTPGGRIAATQSIVDYLDKMFAGDIRAVVPQIAMSGGTMIACACRTILMGTHSNLDASNNAFSLRA